MELQLKPELQAKVERAAAENNSEAAEYVHNSWNTTLSMTNGSVSKYRKVWTSSTAENT